MMNSAHDQNSSQTIENEKKQIRVSHLQKNPPDVFFRKALLKNAAIFTGKHLCRSFLLIKFAGLRSASLLKRDSNTVAFL